MGGVERLKTEERYEEAGVLDLIDPLSDEEWLAKIADAPVTDEPVPEFVRERYATLDARLAERATKRVG